MMKKLVRQINFFAPAAVMSAWGTVMLYVVVSGKVAELLTPLFRGFVLGAGVLLIILSVMHLLMFQARGISSEIARDGSKETDDFGSQVRGLLRALFLTAPLLLCATFSPNALSFTTMENRGDGQTVSASPSIVAPQSRDQLMEEREKEVLNADPKQPVPIEVTDALALAAMPDKRTQFGDRAVRVIGQLAVLPDGSKTLYRLLMWCCAADAKPVGLTMEMPQDATPDIQMPPANVENGTAWMEATGSLTYEPISNEQPGAMRPILKVTALHTANEPDEPFLSPY